MNYDENTVQILAFRLSVKMVEAFEATFELEDKSHLLPTLRALCLQNISSYLMEDRPVALEVKNEVMEFYIDEFNKRTDVMELNVPDTVDTDEDPSYIEVADIFAQLVVKKLKGNVLKEHVQTCLNDMRREDLDTYCVLMGHFFTHSPQNLDDEYPVAFLDDYSLPNDIDLDDVEIAFRDGAYEALPQFSCEWNHEQHPLHVVKIYLDEIVCNSRNIFLNMEEGMKTSLRSQKRKP